jgi:ACR3 family arsenite efflux pump ArsB
LGEVFGLASQEAFTLVIRPLIKVPVIKFSECCFWLGKKGKRKTLKGKDNEESLVCLC